ncbi:MAG TPA: hypothetical protein VIT67_20335 [Povalibacter sp.]
MKLTSTCLVPLALLTLLTTSVSVASEAMPGSKGGCTDFKFNLDHELVLFASRPQAIAAGSATRDTPMLRADQLYVVSLSPQAEVKFAVEPGKPAVTDGSYAGVMNFTPATKGVLRVTLNEAAWIDVVAGDTLIQSRDHTGSPSCKLLHKSVQFEVNPGIALLIQVSGSTTREVKLALTSGT